MRSAKPSSRIPSILKIVYLLCFAIWFWAYCMYIDAENFLWLCDLANIILLFAIWFESSLLFSSQAVGVLLVQCLWTLDFLSALLFGTHPIGGTEYMFDRDVSLWLRSLSLFHVAVPPLLLWGLYRLGYDKRGWKLQTLFVWLLLPTTYLLTDPSLNINWLHRPFGLEQVWVSPTVFFFVMMLAYPLILFLPTHALLKRCFVAVADKQPQATAAR